MASEKSEALSEILSGLSTADQSEIDRYTSQIQVLRKKVGTQRALQIVGSLAAAGGKRPDLISKFKPKFGLTEAERAAKKKGLRTERFGLMGEADKSKEFILKLKADIGKGRMAQQNSLHNVVAKIYVAAKNNASAEAQARGAEQGRGATGKEKAANRIEVMVDATDPIHSPAVIEAMLKVKNKLADTGGMKEMPENPGHLEPESWTALNTAAAALTVPGQKEVFYTQMLGGMANGKTLLARLESGDPANAAPGPATNLHEQNAINMLTKSAADTDLAWSKKKSLLNAATQDRMKAVRMMGTSKHDQSLLDKITETMTAIDGARTPGEADAVLTSLIADFEKPDKSQEAREQQIKNLEDMEKAVDLNLGPKPVLEMYRRMEKSKVVKDTQAKLAAAGYKLTERDTVKLILRNARHQLANKNTRSRTDTGKLRAILNAGGNILSKSLVPNEEAELMAKAEEAAGVTPEEPKLASLKTKVAASVKDKVPKSDDAAAKLMFGADPTGQFAEMDAANMEASESLGATDVNTWTDAAGNPVEAPPFTPVKKPVKKPTPTLKFQSDGR